MTGKSKRRALVAGTFDPVTLGHMMPVEYAVRRYRKVYVTIFINKDKTCLFPVEKRFEMLKAACAKYKNVTVERCDGMLWEYAKEKGVTVTVRGYRNESDLAYENEMAQFNANAFPRLKTELVRCPEQLSQISSTRVRSLLARGEDPSALMPEEAAQLLKNA